ncbi:hypothetical protein [Pseudoponticoccus marisrubri]|uniref:Sulfotransferase domain-containing protein n=1 Tax=Pseudoponticoccus marisrubri TaxID=1685382 RepID=A0A0W7WLY1_9RHOB|nr:hypothetical protein [Pseudoponticoccus marisrubri]KUF11597.1 hypothetical protein AVJ23_07525 [Pseudoponticoccus marisrubri]
MVDAGFRDTGWQIVPGPATPTRVQVFGERSSGTNFVKRLIGRNAPLRPMEDLGWKHGFPHMTAIPAPVAIVAVMRDARDWALSMHAKPWHCPPAMQALPFADFIRAEWATIADRKRYFPQVAALGGQGMPLQHDRHPITGRPFANLFALRRAKLEGLLSFRQRGCTLVLCRLEAVQAAPEDFLQALHDGLDLPRSNLPLRPVVKRLGSKFLPSVAERPATPKVFPEADLPLLRSELDLQQEATLGYSYD